MWRNTAKFVKLGPLDGRAMILVVIFMFHITWWTFYVLCGGIFVLGTVQYYGFTVPVAWRWLRSRIAGKIRYAESWRYRRRL